MYITDSLCENVLHVLHDCHVNVRVECINDKVFNNKHHYSHSCLCMSFIVNFNVLGPIPGVGTPILRHGKEIPR